VNPDDTTRALAPTVGASPSNPMALVQAAIDKGIDPERLGKLLDLAERWEANQAAAEFSKALTAFQRECPPVHKGRPVMGKGGSQVRYSFAGYDDIMVVVGPILARHGICVDFQTPTTRDEFKVVMRIRVGAYYEDKTFSAPMPDLAKLASATYMTEPQAFGTVLSYFKRYTLCAGLNITVTNEDTDAAAPPDGGITAAEVQEVGQMIYDKRVDLQRFLAWAGVKTIRDMDRATYKKAVDYLKRKPVPQEATP
jgi:hypothetical protein